MPRAHLPTARRVLAAAAAGVPLLTTACGPSVPPALAVKAVPLDILVGAEGDAHPPRHDVDVPPPDAGLPAIPVVVEGGAPVVAPAAPPPDFVFPPLAAPPVCAALDPLAVSPAPATPEVASAAQNGAWKFRQDGAAGFGGTPDKVGGTDLWTVSKAGGSQGSYGFEVSGRLLGLPSSVAGVQASNSTTAPANPLVSPTSEVGLGKLYVPTPAGTVAFLPRTPLQLLATPAEPDTAYTPDPNNPTLPRTTGSWKSAVSDPTTGTSMSIQASDVGQVRDNACGTPVDAWRVSATVTIVSSLVFSGTAYTQSSPAATNLTINVTYDVATGMGGMIVAEKADCSGTLGGLPYSCAGYSATVSEPQPEKAP